MEREHAATDATRPRGWTWCPGCFEGRTLERCASCGGSGKVQGAECTRCGGAGEVDLSGPCPACGGKGQVTTAYLRLREAAVLATDPPVRRAGGVEREVWRQTHEGTTAYALAPYRALRDRIRSAARVVLEPVETRDDHGRPLMAVRIATGELVLILSGLSWGYRGTGPNGLATVLHDLGLASDQEEGLARVERLSGRAWHIEREVAP